MNNNLSISQQNFYKELEMVGLERVYGYATLSFEDASEIDYYLKEHEFTFEEILKLKEEYMLLEERLYLIELYTRDKLKECNKNFITKRLNKDIIKELTKINSYCYEAINYNINSMSLFKEINNNVISVKRILREAAI